MNEMNFTDFKPRWMRNLNAEDERILGDTPCIGSFIGRVAKVKAARQPTRAKLDMLEEKITALDISEGKLQLSVEGQGRRVRGTFAMLFLPSLLESLGRRVRLEGHVERRGRTLVSIQVVSAEVLADED